MEPYDFLILLTKTLDGLQIGYRVTGSMASMAYGEFRFTNDIDVVLELPLQLMTLSVPDVW